MTVHQSALRLQQREYLVQAYSHLIRENMDEGRDAYFLNFMFNQLPGSRQTCAGSLENIWSYGCGRIQSHWRSGNRRFQRCDCVAKVRRRAG